jgi:cell wall-associated NlpC family hydrolase
VKPFFNKQLFFCVSIFFFIGCNSTKRVSNQKQSVINPKAKVFTKLLDVNRKDFIAHAKTYIGIPYKYGSNLPANGLDCSGFIQVVFGHFNIKTPRVTRDFTNEGVNVFLKDAIPGDLILFTGSNHASGVVGHMGIITINNGTATFIHSASGKNIGVIESKLTGYWQTHFVKVIRLLKK